MGFWNFVSENWIIIVLILVVWVMGVICGSSISKIKTLFIKNHLKNSNAIRDESISEIDALRYKREYTINLVIQDDKDFPFDSVSDFVFRLEDVIKNDIDSKEAKKSASNKIDETIPEEDEGELVIASEDLEEMANPENYYKG
jgi:hypothetical protein